MGVGNEGEGPIAVEDQGAGLLPRQAVSLGGNGHNPGEAANLEGGVSICVGAVAQSASVNLVPGPDFSVGLETIQWPFPQESSTAPVRPHYRDNRRGQGEHVNCSARTTKSSNATITS